MQMSALQSPQRPATRLGIFRGVIVESRRLDVSRGNMRPRRKIYRVLEPRRPHTRLVFLERRKRIRITGKFIDPGKRSSWIVVPPVRPSRQPSIIAGETQNKGAECLPAGWHGTAGGRDF